MLYFKRVGDVVSALEQTKSAFQAKKAKAERLTRQQEKWTKRGIGQHMHLRGDGLLGKVLMEFGAEGTALHAERGDLLWSQKTVCCAEFVALQKFV